MVNKAVSLATSTETVIEDFHLSLKFKMKKSMFINKEEIKITIQFKIMSCLTNQLTIL